MEVICLRGKKLTHQKLIDDGSIIYCGRNMYQGGWKIPGSKYGNPFKGDQAVLEYFLYLTGKLARPGECPKYIGQPSEIINSLPDLKGKTLACWCKIKGHESCHVDVLIYLTEGKMSEALKRCITITNLMILNNILFNII